MDSPPKIACLPLCKTYAQPAPRSPLFYSLKFAAPKLEGRLVQRQLGLRLQLAPRHRPIAFDTQVTRVTFKFSALVGRTVCFQGGEQSLSGSKRVRDVRVLPRCHT